MPLQVYIYKFLCVFLSRHITDILVESYQIQNIRIVEVSYLKLQTNLYYLLEYLVIPCSQSYKSLECNVT